jgi:hypothetical protein
VTPCILLLERFTQTDPAPCKRCAFDSSYVYAGGRPSVMVDPSGLSFVAGQQVTNSVAAKAPSTNGKSATGKAKKWLYDLAVRTATTVWSSTFGATTTGMCGSLALDVGVSFEGQGCFVDDGNRLGTTEFVAAGVGWGGVSLTGSVMFSNASTIQALGGLGVCVAAGVAVGEGANATAGFEICWGLNGKNPSFTDLDSVNPFDLSKTFIVSGVFGGSFAIPGPSGHAIIGKTFVQEVWNYPVAVDDVCGRVIGNVLKKQSPVCPGSK